MKEGAKEGEIEVSREKKKLYEDSPWSEETPIAHLVGYEPRRKVEESNFRGGQKLHSRIMRVLEALEAVKVTTKRGHDAHWREVALSAGGQGTGKFWTHIPKGISEFFGCDHFLTALRLRLADMELDENAVCQMQQVKDESLHRCEECLDKKGVHLLKCNKGRARFAPHSALEFTMQKCARKYGLLVDLERVVPELYKREADGNIKEAVMDLVIRAPSNPRSRYVDVTIRCPHRKDKDNGEAAGAMAEVGEDDKMRRYGPSVMPLAMESYGRMGPESRESLRQLAMDASVAYRGIPRSAADIYNEWRLKLERTVTLELADIALACLGRWAPRPGGNH